jgi:hypothetical protein
VILSKEIEKEPSFIRLKKENSETTSVFYCFILAQVIINFSGYWIIILLDYMNGITDYREIIGALSRVADLQKKMKRK